VTNWDDYLACTTCEAKLGGPCYALLGRGPQALPSRYAEVPHSARKMRGESRTPRAKSATAVRKAAASLPQRRADRKTATTATGWGAVALEQQRRRESK
jgi:hypothetical protein